jgi:quinol monooxygenase YgiN
MFARSTTVRGDPAAIDRGIDEVRNSVMPSVEEMDGCVGMSMLVDRDSGRCIVTTAWASEDALRSSRERVRDLRARTTRALGAEEPDIREYEIAVVHRERPVPAGAGARVTWLQVPPSNMDRQIDVFRERVLPALQELDGFCSASLLVDRTTGRAAGAVIYESRAALEASREATKAIRSGAVAAAGAELLEVAEFDVALAHLRVPERV